MKPLILEPTEFTPKLEFNPETNIFELSGVSMPEDATAFYNQVIDWINEFNENIINDPPRDNNIIKLNFRLAYCNSASAKFLLSIMERLKSLEDSNTNLEINWYYDAGDDLMLDDGRDLSETVNMPFNFHAIV